VGNTVGSLSEAQHHAAKTHVTASASDPVTTEAARPRWRVSSRKGQIYGRHNTPTPTLGQRG
jgi:hypothetical protein